MSGHSYPREALLPDYLRAAGGFAVTGLPLILGNPSPFISYVLAGLAAVFIVYGARTARRQMTRYELTEAGLTATGLSRASVSWSGLEKFRLRYFSTKKDRSDGWFQLKIASGGGAIQLDSGVTDFGLVATRAAQAARSRDLELDEATRTNLMELGIGYEGSGEEAVEGR